MNPPEVLMKIVANDVQSLVIPGAGHWIAEEAPERMLAGLTKFLAPYRDGSPRGRTPARSPPCEHRTVHRALRPTYRRPRRRRRGPRYELTSFPD